MRTDSQEACLYKADGSCRACVQQCPVHALHDDGSDRHACYSVCLENAAYYEDVCGKCVSVVPGSFTDPTRARAAAR